MPYALIATGGALLLGFVTVRRRDRSRIVTTAVPSRAMIALPATAELGAAEEEERPARPVLRRRRERRQESLAPPALPALSPKPAIPVLDEAAFPSVLTAATVSTSSPPASSDEAASLSRLLESLQALRLQQLLSSLSELQTDETSYLRHGLMSKLSTQLRQLEGRVKELSSGVEVSIDAPLLSHRAEQQQDSSAGASAGELRRHLSALQRQYESLTQAEQTTPPTAASGQAAADTDAADSAGSRLLSFLSSSPSPASSSSILAQAVERATREVEKQMAASFSSLLHEQQQAVSRLVEQMVDVERSAASSSLQQQLRDAVAQAAEAATAEERERWQDIEVSELTAQRDDLLSLSQLFLLRQRAELDKLNDAERERRMAELETLTQRMQSLLAAFQSLLRDTQSSGLLHQVSLAALALDSLSREEEMEREEDAGRIRRRSVREVEAATVQQWRRLWRLRGGDEVIDAAVSSIPQHVLSGGLHSVSQLRQRWRSVRQALKEEAFAPKVEGGSVLAQLLGKLFSFLYLSPSSASASQAVVQFDSGEGAGGAAGGDIDVVDQLNSAVSERRWADVLRLEGRLSAGSRQLCSAWTQAVHDRIVVEQAMQTVKARVVCLSLDM